MPTPFAIDWDGRSNVESLQFSFDGFKKTQFVVLIKLDDVPVPIPIPIPDITPLSPPLGRKSPMPLKLSPLTGLAGYTPIEAAAIALAKASDAANVISASGSLDVLRYGSILNARTIVEVRGAGITYDGELRRHRHPHHQARLLQAELHPPAQRADRRERIALRCAQLRAVGPAATGRLRRVGGGLGHAAAAGAARIGRSALPSLPIPVPPLPSPGAGGPLSAAPPAPPPSARATGASLAPSMPASPTP